VKELAAGVWQLSTRLPDAINAYLLGDVLVDSISRHSAKRIVDQLEGRPVAAHALTHAHADHQGGSHEICETLGVPYWVPALDADAAEDPELIRERQPKNPLSRGFIWMFLGPGHPVDRQLKEGDEVAGFTLIHVPGHSRGHMVFWRESDRVLIAGDVLANINTATGLPGLHLAHPWLTPDPDQNRRSAKEKLGHLEPELVCFGHGRPLRNARKFTEFLAKQPD
jgi:hydroxyacylglutathione hydrolase